MQLLYRDEHLAVFGKPSGLLVHPIGFAGAARSEEAGQSGVPTRFARHPPEDLPEKAGQSGVPTRFARHPPTDFAFRRARQALGQFVFPVHRLDRGASGALAFALSSAVAAALHALFEDGRVDKRYLALVRGVAPDQGVIDHPIPRKEGGPRVPAVTEFRRLAATGGYSLVEARPRSGRLHQIRRHLKHLGHPVIGDANYGRGDHNRLLRARCGLARLALHALSLSFAHPVTGAPIAVTAPVPADLAEPLARLGFVMP